MGSSFVESTRFSAWRLGDLVLAFERARLWPKQLHVSPKTTGKEHPRILTEFMVAALTLLEKDACGICVFRPDAPE
jgi:hypothetical protein